MHTIRLKRVWRASVAAAVIVFVAACGGTSPATRGDGAATGANDETARRKAREEAAAKAETERLAALWNYNETPAGKGQQVSASIKSSNDVDVGDGQPRSVLLVFRDHPSWGRSSYLVLQAGDFNCYGRCTVKVAADAGPAKSMAAHRPRTDEAIAMFVDDAQALWRLTTSARQLRIDFPVKAGGTRTATFDVGGLDSSRMPGWDATLRPRVGRVPMRASSERSGPGGSRRVRLA